MAHRVFISYSTKDEVQARGVVDALEAAGVTCWIAPRNIPSGEPWPSHIIHAIKHCEIVLLLLTANSNSSPEVLREINQATKHRCRILTVRIDGVFPSGDLEYYLSGTQRFDAFESPLESYFESLLHAVLTPTMTLQLDGPEGRDGEDDEHFVGKSINEIAWRLAELEDSTDPLSCSTLDDVLEPATELTSQLRHSRRWGACQKIYLETARGLLRILDSASPAAMIAWPVEIEHLHSRLRYVLEKIAANLHTPESAVDSLHRLFADFLDRVPPSRSRKSVRRVTIFALLSFLAVSGISLLLAYSPGHTTATWEVRYAFAYGPSYPRIGGYLEFSRSVLLVVVVIYLFEILFRPEFERLLLDWKIRSWKRPWVAIVRLFGLALVVITISAVCDHVLVKAPEREAKWADDYLTGNAATAKLFDPKLITQMRTEANAELFADHARPYHWYLPYCLVNYAVYAALLLTLCLYAILSDRWRLVEERDGFERLLVNQRLTDSDIDRKFVRFSDACIRHTRRYVTLLLWIAIVIAYESIVTRKTLSDYGWAYELLTSSVAGLCTLVWVGVLVHFYEGAFQRCCNEKRRRHGLSDAWERKWNTTNFLTKCFLNLRSGVALGVYLVPIILVMIGRH